MIYWEDVLYILIVIIVVLGIVFGSLILGNEISRKACKTEAYIMGLDYEYNLWVSCMVKQGDRWVKLDNYRYELEELT